MHLQLLFSLLNYQFLNEKFSHSMNKIIRFLQTTIIVMINRKRWDFCFFLTLHKNVFSFEIKTRDRNSLLLYSAFENHAEQTKPGSHRPRGLMDKASDFESEDWGFESLRGWPSVCVSELPEINHNLVLVEAYEPVGFRLTLGYNFRELSGLHGCDCYLSLSSTNCITVLDSTPS